MRKDIAKVLVERPRLGQTNIANKTSRVNTKILLKSNKEEIEPENISGMKRIHKIAGFPKSLNENLKPLRRFLHSKIGKNWNDVYSEIMENLNLNNSVQYHVWQHLIKLGEVHTSTYMKDGKVWIGGDHKHFAFDKYYSIFYVHPETNILEYHHENRYRRKKKKELFVKHKNNKYIQYHKINNVWYEIQLRDMTEKEKSLEIAMFGELDKYKFIEDLHKEYIKNHNYYITNNVPEKVKAQRCFGDYFYPIAKRQLNTKEIKKLGLK